MPLPIKFTNLLAVALFLSLFCGAASALRLNRLEDPLCRQKALYADLRERGSVVLDSEGNFEFRPSSEAIDDAVAWGSFLDGSRTVSNFGQLRVTTSGEFSDVEQTFAAGFLEGWMTAPRVRQNYDNLHAYFLNTLNASLEGPMRWVEEQDAWVRSKCEEERGFAMPPGEAAAAPSLDNHRRHNKDDKKSEDAARFWVATCLAIRQFDGLVAGFRARATAEASEDLRQMSYSEFLFLESNGDLYDIIDKLDPSQRPSWNAGGDADDAEESGNGVGGKGGGGRSRDEAEVLFHKMALSGKCSALVKLAADLSDIYMGHSTWDSFTAMLRIYKHYSFNLTQLNPPAQRLSFSSYPGEVFSDDDFFILSSKLVILQTTNKIFNDDLFDALNSHSVLSWQRVRAANWLADSGEEWVRYLGMENSGTYNNQYMVIDLKKFTPGEGPEPGLLWVAEQIPGLVASADATSTLALGYWPSFNVPAFPEIYNASGYPDFVSKLSKYGQKFSKTTHWLSWTSSPRANIFRRDQSAVTSLEGMKAIMRGNNWQNDPLSEGRSIAAICGRGDLDPNYPEARGCYDSKVTSWRLALDMQAEAVNGPTTGGTLHSPQYPTSAGKLPAFTWPKIEKEVDLPLKHEGQPEKFDFKFERMAPELGVEAECEGARAGTLASGRL